MPKQPRDIPPPLELLCLRALWTLTEGNVRDVQRIVAQNRPLAYTTIMTVLDRLVRKGRLSRRKVGRAFLYQPLASRDAMRHTAISDLLESFFDGSEEQLLHFLRPPLAASAAVGAQTVAAPAPQPADDHNIDTVLL
jgi:predicted transcriptional regulator